MRVCTVFIIAFVIVLGFGCFWALMSSPRPRTSGPLGVVHFTDLWTKVRDDVGRVGITGNTHFVLKKSAAGKLLFSVKQGWTGEEVGTEVYRFPVKNPEYDYYSDDRYSVSLDGQFRVEATTAQEWDAAEEVMHSYHFIRSRESAVSSSGVLFRDRVFARSGESWGNEAALVSPSGKWIAIFSYTGAKFLWEPSFPLLGKSPEPWYGEAFLDVYDTTSGEKLIAAHGPYGRRFGGFSPSMIFSQSLWVEDRYIVMPLDWSLKGCYLGILPERK